MATFTRTNGAGFDHGVQYGTAQIIAIEIDAGVDLTAKDGIDGAVEAIAREFSPLLYKSTGTAGKIFAIVDGHAVTAASLTARLQALGTVDGVDLSGEVVLVRDLDAFSAT